MMNELNYGTRAKIGLIYPSAGWVMEPEMYYMVPTGVSVQTTRVMITSVDKENLNKELIPGIHYGAQLLDTIPVDIMLLGCTSASFINGPEFEKKFIADMEAEFKVPFTTTSSSVKNALEAIGAKKIAVATPYSDEANEAAKNYLSYYNYDIVNFRGMNLMYDYEIDAVPVEGVYKFAKDTDVAEADALVILCTGLRTIPMVELLEKQINKPVITAIQASTWNCLNILGMSREVSGCGRLFEV